MLKKFVFDGTVEQVRFQLIKVLPLLLIIVSALFYQTIWFSAFNKLTVTYDFPMVSPVSANRPQVQQKDEGQFNSIIDFMDFFIEELATAPTNETLNLTQVILNNIDSHSQLIITLELLSNHTIQSLQDLYDYAGVLSHNILIDFFRGIWIEFLESQLPDGWKEEGKITLFNDSTIKLDGVTITGLFRVDKNITTGCIDSRFAKLA